MDYREIKGYGRTGLNEAGDEVMEEMAELFMGAFNAPPWNDSWSRETAEERLCMMLDGRAAWGFAAYEDGKMCALAVGCFERYCERLVFNLREFCVKRSIKGMGRGTEFFREMEKRLIKMGVCELTLNTLRGEETEGFYIKQGMKNDMTLTAMAKKL